MIYRLILKANDALYRSGRRASSQAVIPTVCIGNITAGGTGKTPHTEMVLRLLEGSDEWGGRRIAMLSRGYKRRSKGFLEVPLDGRAALCGDEPLQIKRNVPTATVAVCRDRLEGCRRLKEDFGADIAVLDDAFQYRKLKADVNIVLVDWNRPVSSDSLLPFGRLRDLPERLGDADMIIVTKCPIGLEDEEKDAFLRAAGMMAFAERTFFTTISYRDPEAVFQEGDRHYLYSSKAILLTAIAGDAPFRRFLSSDYKFAARFRFPDHHRFSRRDIRRVAAAADLTPVAAIFTTQKDAQRLMDCKKVPDSIKSRTFAVPIEAVFSSEQEASSFRKRLLDMLSERR